MKNATTIGMIGAIVLAVGVVGINFSDGSIMQKNQPSATQDGGAILGHIEIIQRDSEGNIKAYQQTDNKIINGAKNCVVAVLFGKTSTNTCTIANGTSTVTGLGKYTFIGLGNTTATMPASTSNDLPGEITLGDGLNRAAGTLGTFTNATADAAGAKQVISKTFSYTGSQTNTIYAAGLFNQTTTGATSSTFALKAFPSTVTLTNGDSLTVNWEITING
ncbi:hypothetical protein [Candidatus Nitrosarchaeum limnium]|uniref:Uncharacterized protein n=1 Tax=Candidatus Nitrosarchaeum limnium BG20 TaxID=859192 RepID=S2EUL4_9ARCH|nr:hypothetical protein [Candidatus Nitrosarchaeum limnium]EPA05994.1 hypothetical protein BG20_I1997 [Candidatus Nitrosarchaeum limnium BG20]